ETVTALIINEQNKIQKPVIENTYFKKHVFHTALFKLQEMLHISAVIFPTVEGRMYGFSVYQFETLQKRIELGQKLAELLFHPNYKSSFHRFALQTIHTGSRADYEYYVREARKSCTPALREVYPVVAHKEISMRDWFCRDTEINELFLLEEYKGEVDITEWYKRKREQIYVASIVNRFVKRMDEFVI
ncbi:DUF2515 family protein, partial [Bacillus wiedmannii]